MESGKDWVWFTMLTLDMGYEGIYHFNKLIWKLYISWVEQ